MHTQISATNRVIPYVKKSHVLTQLFHCNFGQKWDTIWDIKTEKSLPEHSRRDFCGDSRIRTGDPMLAKHVLYQLSYTPRGLCPAPLKGKAQKKPGWRPAFR